MHTEESVRKRLDEERNLKARRLYLIAEDGDGGSADAFGGRERTVDNDADLVHKLSIQQARPMRLKDRTAPLFITLEARAGQLAGHGSRIPLLRDSWCSRRRRGRADNVHSKELCGALVGCGSATLSSADKSRHSTYNFQVTSARGGVFRVSGDDDIVRFAVLHARQQSAQADRSCSRTQRRPDQQASCKAMPPCSSLPSGSPEERGASPCRRSNKDPKKVCAARIRSRRAGPSGPTFRSAFA